MMSINPKAVRLSLQVQNDNVVANDWTNVTDIVATVQVPNCTNFTTNELG